MAAGTTLLTLEQFHARHAHEHGYEYWFGEVVQKGMPTWLHGLVQAILAEFFYKLGYASGSEIELRIDPNWQPRPDVIASSEIQPPYPTRPVDIVAEVLSDDPMTKVLKSATTMRESAFLKFLSSIRNPRQPGSGVQKRIIWNAFQHCG